MNLDCFTKSAPPYTHESNFTEKRLYSWRWRVLVGCCVMLGPIGYTHRAHIAGHLKVPQATSALKMTARASAPHDAALRAFAQALGWFVVNSGALTDELRYPLSGLSEMPVSPNSVKGPFHFGVDQPWYTFNHRDVRILPEVLTPDTLYQQDELGREYLHLQGARAVLSKALEQIATYESSYHVYDVGQPALSDTATADWSDLKERRGELYAVEGYTDILLADLFCSGVPLNTFNGPDIGDVGNMFWTGRQVYISAIADKNIVYHPSSTTVQVYEDAIAKFDTALTFAHDSARILNLARVGKGRAWLALGQYDSAAAAVALVPTGFSYLLRTWMELDMDDNENIVTVADREGRNGLPYISSGDPRTATEWVFSDKVINKNQMPAKYWQGGKYRELRNEPKQTIADIPFPLASGEEAVLIKAEAALHRNPADLTWLHLLNQLRATAPIPGTGRPNPSKLEPLTDPGSDSARISLLFAERAKWLFMTGHRQGDLRRLVRQYHRPQDQVYPTGPYTLPKGILGAPSHYGTDVNMPIPPEERTNPLFHGCIDRGA